LPSDPLASPIGTIRALLIPSGVMKKEEEEEEEEEVEVEISHYF